MTRNPCYLNIDCDLNRTHVQFPQKGSNSSIAHCVLLVVAMGVVVVVDVAVVVVVVVVVVVLVVPKPNSSIRKRHKSEASH